MLIGATSLVAVTVWLVAPRAVVIQQIPVPATSQAELRDRTLAPSMEHPTVAGRQVMVNLSASPSEAVIHLDGRRVSNPYSATHGSASAPHHVSVTLHGYETLEEDLVFDAPVSMSYTLIRDSEANPGMRRRARGLRPGPVGHQPLEDSEALSAESGEAPGPGENLGTPGDAPAAPGEDLGGFETRQPLQDLDERDPYK